MAAESLPSVISPRARGKFAPALNAVIFLASLAVASSALTAFSPFPDLGNLSRKYQHIVRHGGDYPVIYIGSSRVFHEFIPAKFDAEMAARGKAMKSFNFGQPGMWPPESFYMLRKILATHPPNLRWVFVDLMGIRPYLEGNAETLRATYWHDIEHTWLACRHVIASKEAGFRTWPEKVGACGHHWKLCMLRASSIGAGHEQLEVLLGLKRRKTPGDIADGGYEPGDPGPLAGAQREIFFAALEGLKRNPPPRPIPGLLRDALAKITEEIRAAGAEPVFVVASTLYGVERFSDWPPAGVSVLAFDDPAKYPQLYDPERRFDPHHLDPAGAEEFTRLLAARFAELLESRR